MRALITGATGFVGSYLTELLVRRGETVAILLRPRSDTWRIKDALPQVTQIEGDLLALSGIEDQIREFAPDTVFHLAWYGVGNSHRNDDAQIDDNLHSSVALMRLALSAGCRTWVGLGSQAEYGPQNAVLKEDAPAKPTTGYGVAKLCACLLSEHLATAAGARFVWLRLFSSYGPKDNPGWMIPYLIRSLLNGETPDLTPGGQRWDYLYVADAAEAIYAAAKAQEPGGVFNLGSGQAHALRSIVERIRDLIDPALALNFGAIPYRPDQVMHLEADIGKLQSLGWNPRTSLDDGLRKTVEWFQSRNEVRA